MVADLFVHRLAFALRVDEHFSREPLGEPVEVRLDTGEPAVDSLSGSARHSDGTYRWANLSDGLRRVTLRSASGRWVRWDPAPLDVVVPVPDQKTALVVEMWPTPLAAAPPGVSTIRGKLVGAGVAGLRVEIDGTGAPPTGRWTFADAQGELMYLLPGGPWPMTAARLLDLTISIPGRTVAGVEVLPGPTSFTGAQFAIPPQREIRARFHVL
ncbi:hypothetical protein [Sorangium sp. So ce394]|uniref:hypothetical protein n=1 Tax=Sorangium sp. So ce394 TaxID=3133310 RepID=UPI003F5C6B03